MCDFAHAASSQRVGIAPIPPVSTAWSSKRNAHPTEKLTVKRSAKLIKADRLLVDAATAAIKQRYRNDWQEVGAALRTRSGKIFTGVNLDAYLGRMAVCAEAVALGRAFVELGDDGIETIVAVRHPPPDEKDQNIRGGVAVRRLPRADLRL